MAYPENPETIILKNKYYPKGLKEIDVWNYYQKNKSLILDQTRNRELMFAIVIDTNKTILRRKGKEGIIKLTPQNYDNYITGRSLTIYSTMGQYEDIGIIDIDSDKWNLARIAASDVYDFVMDKMPIIRSATLKFSGKTGFHILCHFSRKIKIDTIRYLLRQELQKSELINNYTIESKRRPGIPNLDLSPNKYRGAYITLGSLSIIGLRCMNVGYNEILRFDPYKAKI